MAPIKRRSGSPEVDEDLLSRFRFTGGSARSFLMESRRKSETPGDAASISITGRTRYGNGAKRRKVFTEYRCMEKP